MNGKKILLVIPNLGRGGAQQVFRDHLQFFSTQYQTLGCVFNFDDSFEDDRDGKILSLKVPAGKNIISKVACFLKRIIALRKIKREHNIDVCISHLEGADYINLLSKGKEKIICWIHGSKSFDANISGTLGAIRKKILIPLTYRQSDLIVTVSEGIRQELISDFSIPSNKITTIYNSFHVEEISTRSEQSLGSPFEELFDLKTTLITHCRLSLQKNLIALLDIFKEVKKQKPDVKLVILGDGELRADILKYSATNFRVYTVWDTDQQFDLDFDVYFLGYERNPYPFLSRASLYVMTSAWEGFPLSLCEAMACGIPVMSTDCYTGPREIIAPHITVDQPIKEPFISTFGILMPLAENHVINKTWADTILDVLDNLDLRHRLSASGKERVKEFDKNKITLQWLKIIQ